MHTGIEDFKILCGERRIHGSCVSHFLSELGEVCHVGLIHVWVVVEEVAKAWKVGVVGKVVSLQPELAEQWCHKRCNHTANVDEHIENLES